MALSENVNHLVYTVDNDLLSISALNTDVSEAIESMLLYGVSKLKVFNRRSPLTKLSAEHDAVGMVAKTDATFRRTLVQFRKGCFMQCVDDFCRCLY